MFKILRARLFQGYRTGKFPYAKPNLPAHFHGYPILDATKLTQETIENCPVDAIKLSGGSATLDLGRCIFCGKCAEHSDAVLFTNEYRMGTMSRDGLIVNGIPSKADSAKAEGIRRLCGRSLKIRQVSAGGCAACELDFNVLHTLAWDMGRFGIQAVASPRHADALLVTGPVTKNMLTALKKTYDAMPKPCFVIVSGACAISGGLYRDQAETMNGVESVLPVDCYVPGCPPHPAVLLDALLRFIGSQAVAPKE